MKIATATASAVMNTDHTIVVVRRNVCGACGSATLALTADMNRRVSEKPSRCGYRFAHDILMIAPAVPGA